MKGKLIKTDVNYILEDDKGIVIASTSLKKEGLSLSLKNCQTIERGYDLDGLAMGYDLYENINFVGQMRAYKEGFQKALELMGDKKFSEDDIINLIKKSREKQPYNFDGRDAEYKFSENDIIQSLQRTEWDVEVETEEITLPFGANQFINDYKPKLDTDGCLILKRI